jgi:hypothetical protein
MKYCIVIGSSPDYINLIRKFVTKQTYYKPLYIRLNGSAYFEGNGLFDYLADQINQIHYADLRESLVLVDDIFSYKTSTASRITNQLDDFWARMILAYPELEFLFLNHYVQGSRSIADFLSLVEEELKFDKESIKYKAPSFAPLFDPLGIRNELRKNVNKLHNGIITRDKKARIIEDELSYAYFHGYIAFKNFHRCELYTSLAHLCYGQKTFSSTKAVDITEVDLQIQDLSLGYADKVEGLKLSSIAERYKQLNFLEHVKDGKNFVITVGPKNPQKDGKAGTSQVLEIGIEDKVLKEADGSRYIAHLPTTRKSASPVKLPIIYKPTKGMYDIAERLKFDIVEETKVEETGDHHSAPGMISLLAEHLIARAQHIIDNARNVEDAIHAAILALEAKEQLNGLTPTLALQALSIQHKAEVIAECMFVGTEYNIELKPRFSDIEKEVFSISNRFEIAQRVNVQLNTQLSIIETLSGIYGAFKQFEEELNCLNQARKLKFKLIAKKQGDRWRSESNSKIPKLIIVLFRGLAKPIRYLFQPVKQVLVYLLSISKKHLGNSFGDIAEWIIAKLLGAINFSMSSPSKFLVSIFAIQLIYSVIYFAYFVSKMSNYFKHYCTIKDYVCSIYRDSLTAAIKYFFTSESNSYYSTIFNNSSLATDLILGSQGLLSLGSLSIFMAMIVTRLTRK